RRGVPDGHVNDVADAVGELVYLGRGVVAQCRALAAPQYGCPLPRGPRRLAGKGRVDTAIEGLPPSAPQPRPDEARSQPGRLGLPARDHAALQVQQRGTVLGQLDRHADQDDGRASPALPLQSRGGQDGAASLACGPSGQFVGGRVYGPASFRVVTALRSRCRSAVGGVGICLPREGAGAHGGSGVPLATMEPMAIWAIFLVACAARRSSTSGCRRRSPTTACARRWRPAARSPGCRCSCCPSTWSSSTPVSCWPTRTARSGTCSRTACSTTTTSS